MKFPLDFYQKDGTFFFSSSLTSSVVSVRLFKISVIVYITPGKISVPGKKTVIREPHQASFPCLYPSLFYEQSNHYTLILYYLCNSLHLTSSTSFRDFLTFSNPLIRNWAVDLSKYHHRPSFSMYDLWVSLDKPLNSLESMTRVPDQGLQRRAHLQCSVKTSIVFTKPRKSSTYS